MTEAPGNGSTSGDKAVTIRAEAIRAAAISEAPVHRRLLQSARGGRILSAIMLRVFTISTPHGHGVLTTTGRKSGRQRRNYVRAIRRHDKVYVVMLRPPALAIERPLAVSSWVWNIRGNPNIHLRLRRRTFAGVAREISDPTELRQAREAICETVHLVDYGECRLHLRGRPSRAKIKDLHGYWFDTGIPLVIELAE
ncbi:deazaflavin-dependent oxidoreductase, nitroreductase family [Rhodococcus jostii]|uniref:Deazaflavin-dependent oxidoreductase, nitroreductase family n=1 Tax=Rhodococcus jostii TaxID=132919 RepID=A0A1H5MEY1_RHOJO|nr:deazaflavin-dependent oxidoreductase, nitroreductase family [Rhodococcus jostii]